MKEYKIEKGIPIPETKNHSVSKYAFLNNMAIGDSIAVNTRHECAAIKDAMRYRKIKFVCTLEPGGDRYRIWRTE